MQSLFSLSSPLLQDNPWRATSRPYEIASCGERTLEAIPLGQEARVLAPVTVQAGGASWNGFIQHLTIQTATLVIEGILPNVKGYHIDLGWEYQGQQFQFSGWVQRVQLHHPDPETNRILALTMLWIQWIPADEMTTRRYHKWLKDRMANQLERCIAFLRYPETGNVLFEVTPALHMTQGKNPIQATFPQSLEHGAQQARIVADSHLEDQLPELAQASHPRVVSNMISCLNDNGQKIVAYHDCLQTGLPHGSPVVVIAPGYGETKREYITLAYYLASNGCHVVRYDHTHHVGDSDGDHVYTSLSAMQRDMQAILQYAQARWPESHLGVVATSLAGRVALKAVGMTTLPVKLLVVITGIFDLRATLTAVHHEDLVGDYLHGKERGVTNVLGFNVDGRVFLKDAVEAGFADLETTLADLARLNTPLLLFNAQHDTWVQPQELERVVATLATKRGRAFVIPEALHRLVENPRKARAVYRHIVYACQEYLGIELPTHTVIEPSRRDMGRQNRLEREQNKARRFRDRADHVHFWQHYLDHFHYITNSPDYLAALDHMIRLAGAQLSGLRILDAGCGNGPLATFLFLQEWERQKRGLSPRNAPLYYTGIDLVAPALQHARNSLEETRKTIELREGYSASTCMQASFQQADLNAPLPFQDAVFDIVLSNLVLGYLSNPVFSLQELLRVVVPGGRLVITNLKPYADLTQIYRNFVEQVSFADAIEEARQVLNNSSAIRQGEMEGTFRFYTAQTFATLLRSCGAANVDIYPTFANQAYVAVAQKPLASSISRENTQTSHDLSVAA